MQSSQAAHYLKQVDFQDSYTAQVNSEEKVHILYLQLVNNPSFLTKILMKVRNFFVQFLGLKSVIDPSANSFEVGKKVGLFTLYDIQENEIIAGEKDKHLDFCISFKKEQDVVILSTYVCYHNMLGKIYMNLIKPFHKLLVKKSLKSLHQH